MAKHNETGDLGEDIAFKWLVANSYEVIDRNYRKKWGEIDIVACLPDRQAHETQRIHFIEVKTVSYETRDKLDYAVSHETWRPEDNVHIDKLKRLGRAIESWNMEHNYAGEFVIDVITVKLVPREKLARVKLIENVILE